MIKFKFYMLPEFVLHTDMTYSEVKILSFFVTYKLLTNPDGEFYYSNEQLAELLNMNEYTVSKSVNKLCELGYLQVVYKMKNGGGQLRFVTYTDKLAEKLADFIKNDNLVSTPNSNLANDTNLASTPSCDLVSTPSSINLSNTNSSNTKDIYLSKEKEKLQKEKERQEELNKQCQEVLDYFNQVCNKQLTLKGSAGEVRKRIIRSRLEEGKTVEQLKQAILNFSKDDWEDRHKYCDIVYAIGVRNKIDNFEKWYNWKPKPKQKIVGYNYERYGNDKYSHLEYVVDMDKDEIIKTPEGGNNGT